MTERRIALSKSEKKDEDPKKKDIISLSLSVENI